MNAPANQPIRVYQVATGNVGTEMIKRLQTHRDLKLVGLHCYTAEKIGKDAGEIAGIGPIGVKATGTIEEIIAAKPDVLTFHGVFPDEELYVKVLEAGINIVTTADWITGWHRDKNHPHASGRKTTEILQEACEKGGVSFYGTGMNPGLNQILGVVCSADVAEIENVTAIESVDVSCHHSKDTWIEVGYGRPVDDPEIPAMLEKYTRVFADSVLMMADCFDLTLDEVNVHLRPGRLHKRCRPGLVPAAQRVAGRELHQVPGHGGRNSAGRDASGMADDPAHGPELGYQGLLHYPDQG